MGEPPIKRQRVNTKFHKIVFQHQFLCDVKVVAYVKEADLMSESKYELFENDPKDCATASLIQCIQDIEEQKHDHDLWQSLKNPHSGWILKEWNKEFLLLEDEIRNDPDFCYSMVVENNVEEFLASFPLPSLAFLKEVIPLAVRSIDYENIKKQLCTIAFHFETPELSFLPHQVLTIQNGFPKCPISVVMVTPYEENFWRKWSNPSKIVKDPNNWKMSTCLLPIQQAKLLLDEKVVAGIIVSPEKFLSFVKPFPNRLSNEQRLQKVRGEMTIDSLLKVLLSKEPKFQQKDLPEYILNEVKKIISFYPSTSFHFMYCPYAAFGETMLSIIADEDDPQLDELIQKCTDYLHKEGYANCYVETLQEKPIITSS